MANISAITKENSMYIMNNFIDIDLVRERASKLDVIANENIESWITNLEKQINDGGLDPYALNIGGDPILNTYAVGFTNELKQRKSMIQNVKTEIINIAKKHRNAELKKLEEVLLEEKRDKEESLANLQQDKEKDTSKINQYEDQINQIIELLDRVRGDECYNYIGGE